MATEAMKIIKGILVDHKASINYHPDGRDLIPTISDYIEQIRVSLWEAMFYREFAIEKTVHKNFTINKQYLFKPALHRVIYKYFKYVLFRAKTISRSQPFFLNYLENGSEDFMPIVGIMKQWDKVHCEGYGCILTVPLTNHLHSTFPYKIP